MTCTISRHLLLPKSTSQSKSKFISKLKHSSTSFKSCSRNGFQLEIGKSLRDPTRPCNHQAPPATTNHHQAPATTPPLHQPPGWVGQTPTRETPGIELMGMSSVPSAGYVGSTDTRDSHGSKQKWLVLPSYPLWFFMVYSNYLFSVLVGLVAMKMVIVGCNSGGFTKAQIMCRAIAFFPQYNQKANACTHSRACESCPLCIFTKSATHLNEKTETCACLCVHVFIPCWQTRTNSSSLL